MAGKVRGHNDAIYGPVPKEGQLLDVEFLEIAPTPIIAYAAFFIGYLMFYTDILKRPRLFCLPSGLHTRI